ncbi:MAG: CvpA family protein [Clostridiales bacterium]|jgi:uncharacterized membrane protein required for colicin V production|nr:CvpA family protein [Clostridiales bacterium]
MAIIDIAVIGMVALFAIFGLASGVFKSVIKFFGGLIALVAAVLLTKTVAYALLDVKAVQGFVVGGGGGFSLYKWLLEVLPAAGSESGILAAVLKPVYAKIAELFGSGTFLYATEAQAFALIIAYGIFSIMVCVGLYIAIRLIMTVIIIFLKHFAKEKPGGVSRLLGFFVGAVRGAVLSAFLLVVMSFTLSFPLMAPVAGQIDGSVLAKPITEYSRKLVDMGVATAGDDETMKKLIGLAGLDVPAEAPPEPELPDTPETPDDNQADDGGGQTEGGDQTPEGGGEPSGGGGGEPTE